MRTWMTLAACVLISSCAYVDATTTQYIGVPRFAPGEAKSVQVLNAEPMKVHDRLGEILLDISVDPPAQIAEIEQRLREETAKMGGNAVFVVRDMMNPNVSRKLIAVAIRYR